MFYPASKHPSPETHLLMDQYTSYAPPQHTTWLRDDRHAYLLAGMMWVLIVLMIVPDGFDYQTLVSTGAPSSGGVVSRVLWLSLLVPGALILFWRAGLAWVLLRTINPFLLLFVALAFASIAWSIDPALSARRLLRMGTIVLTCTAFVLMAWHARRFQNVVRPILTAVLFGSILFGLAFPSLAIHHELSAELAGAWRGLANHKNSLGALASIALIFWFHGWLTREVKPVSALAGGAIAAACLVLSRSSTSMAATIAVMVLLVVLLRAPQGLRPYFPYFLSLLLAIILFYALALLNIIPGMSTLLAPLSALTGKDMSMTGRTEIWTILFEHIRYHPLLGTGYGAYWTAGPVPGTDSYAYMWRMRGFYPGSAHNGYLEIINDLGWVGFSCLYAYLVAYLWLSLQMLRVDFKQGALYLALLFQQAMTNLAETHWFSVLSVDFVIMALATIALARGALEFRLRALFGDPSASVPESPGLRAAPRMRSPGTAYHRSVKP